MRQVITVIVIVVAAWILASIISPPDLVFTYVNAGAILLIAIPSYLIGVCEGRRCSREDKNQLGCH